MSQPVEEYDYYGILGINISAGVAGIGEPTIKKAYKAKALAVHPDKNKNLEPLQLAEKEKEFQLARKAYDMLIHPGKKKVYDYLLDKYGKDRESFKARMKVCDDYMYQSDIEKALDKLADASPEKAIKFLKMLDEQISELIAQQNPAAKAPPPPPMIIQRKPQTTSPPKLQFKIGNIEIDISPSTLTIKFEGINLATALNLSDAIINSLNESGFKITNDLLSKAQKNHLNPNFSVTSFPKGVINEKQIIAKLSTVIHKAQDEERKKRPAI